MHAAGVVQTLPLVRMDDDVLSAVRVVVRHDLPGFVAADEQGRLVGCVSAVDLLGLALPAYMRDEPGLARTFDEEHADRIAAALVGTRVRDAIGATAGHVPVARPQATVVELIELMTRCGCPFVLVADEAGGLLGAVTANRLLDLLVNAAEGPLQ